MVLVSIIADIPLPEEVRSLTLHTRLKRIDFLGSLTLVLTVGSLMLGLSLRSMEGLPWSHPLVWGLISASGIWGFVFLMVETKIAVSPVMPIRLVKQRSPLTIAVATFFASIGSYSMIYNVPLVRGLDHCVLWLLILLLYAQYFSAGRLNSSTDAGLHLLPHSVRRFNAPNSMSLALNKYQVSVSCGGLIAGW